MSTQQSTNLDSTQYQELSNQLDEFLSKPANIESLRQYTMSIRNTQTTIAPAKQEVGFNLSMGVDWSKYVSYRPIYPASFFERIYSYHSQNPLSAWSTAHEVGAGCGIVSSNLASRFANVVVSDPNDGYTALARKLLIEDSGLPESKFTFYQEGAEKSSVKSTSVDLVIACECIHWADTEVAIKEFNRQLKVGGTAVFTHYAYPRISGNEKAREAWKKIWDYYITKPTSKIFDHCFPIFSSGYESLEFPTEQWDGVKRVYINAQGSAKAFIMDGRVGLSRVKEGEEKIFVEDDQDWCDLQDINYLKGYFSTWVPKIPEEEIQELWDEMEKALGGGKVKIETPIVMVFARKRA